MAETYDDLYHRLFDPAEAAKLAYAQAINAQALGLLCVSDFETFSDLFRCFVPNMDVSRSIIAELQLDRPIGAVVELRKAVPHLSLVMAKDLIWRLRGKA